MSSELQGQFKQIRSKRAGDKLVSWGVWQVFLGTVVPLVVALLVAWLVKADSSTTENGLFNRGELFLVNVGLLTAALGEIVGTHSKDYERETHAIFGLVIAVSIIDAVIWALLASGAATRTATFTIGVGIGSIIISVILSAACVVVGAFRTTIEGSAHGSR